MIKSDAKTDGRADMSAYGPTDMYADLPSSGAGYRSVPRRSDDAGRPSMHKPLAAQDWPVADLPVDVIGTQDDMALIGVDMFNAKEFEQAFPPLMIAFLERLNFTRDEEDVFALLIEVAQIVGFRSVIYEYNSDPWGSAPVIFAWSNLSKAMTRLENWMRSLKSNKGQVTFHTYGRRHCMYKWTPGVAGKVFADMYGDYPEYQRKLKVAAIIPGVRSGFGVPLRCPSPLARAGLSFAGDPNKEEALAIVSEHGASLTTIAWAAHMRLLQHMNPARAPVDLRLTARQMQYVILLADGLLDKQIAHEMGISLSGVRKHFRTVCSKLGVMRRGEIPVAAARYGLLVEPGVDGLEDHGGPFDHDIFGGRPELQEKGEFDGTPVEEALEPLGGSSKE